MNNMKLGDTVRLKCGSPFMVISEIIDDECVAVAWYFDGMIKDIEVPSAILEVVDIDKEMKRAESAVISALKSQFETQSGYAN